MGIFMTILAVIGIAVLAVVYFWLSKFKKG